MANTVLKFGDRSARMNYHDLAEVLSILNQRLETASAAREVTEPWQKHIQEDLGYVLLDTNALDGSNVISEFNAALSQLSFDLRSGRVSPDTPRWRNVSSDIRQQSDYAHRMQYVIRELQRVLTQSG